MKRRAFLAMLAALFLPWRKRNTVQCNPKHIEGTRYFMCFDQHGRAIIIGYNTRGVPYELKV